MREVRSLMQQGATYGQVLDLAAQGRVTAAALRQYHTFWLWGGLRFSETQRRTPKVKCHNRINRVRRVLGVPPIKFVTL